MSNIKMSAPAKRIVTKNTNIWIEDEKRGLVPGIEFQISDRYDHEIYIYYNAVDGTWFGNEDGSRGCVELDSYYLTLYIQKFNLKELI